MTNSRMIRPARSAVPNSVPRGQALALSLAFCLAAAARANAQLSLSTSVDLALSHSPKIRMAQADVVKAEAGLDQARDVYVPSIIVGAGLGQSYGYSFNPPTLFTVNAGSLVFNYSQRDYIRASRRGLEAAQFGLLDARQAVTEDTALTFLALQHDQQREAALAQQNEIAGRIVQIVQDRLDAGRDAPIDLTQAKLTAAQYRLARLQAEDETARDRNHLAILTGVALGSNIRADGEFPRTPLNLPPDAGINHPVNPAVKAAYATAVSKLELARGDARFMYRPQVSLVAQYNRYATFTNSFKQLESIQAGGYAIGANESAFGVQIQLPLLDREHKAKARESAAEALRTQAQADDAQQAAVDGQLRLRHSLEVLRARTEVAELDQQLAQQQLDILTAQLDTATANPNTPPPTPKDEQMSRLAEREKYLALLDSSYQLHRAQINLLRQTGRLQDWIQESLRSSP